MSKHCIITPEQAYIDYLSMGPQRSLAKLHAKYTRTTPKPPSLDTLKSWSRRHYWRTKVAVDDQEAEFMARRLRTHRHAQTLYDQRNEFYAMGITLLHEAREVIENGDVTDLKQAVLMAHLCDSAIACIQCADSMKG